MKSMIRKVIRKIDDQEIEYEVLAFVCPGCTEQDGSSGLHMLPVNTDKHQPVWNWDGDLEKPTLNPSILTGKGTSLICHSYLRAGVFEFLSDCTHSLKNQFVPMPDLPDWFIEESNEV